MPKIVDYKFEVGAPIVKSEIPVRNKGKISKAFSSVLEKLNGQPIDKAFPLNFNSPESAWNFTSAFRKFCAHKRLHIGVSHGRGTTTVYVYNVEEDRQ